ncbi:MAG: Fur family transcriptional regulator [Trueperella sp.]|nr:Fur family transcriptional regulator [Trueperella sp.]
MKNAASTEEFAELLRTVGLRVTQPRLAVLAELATHPHSTPEMVRRGVSKRLGSVSTQAIYDVLHALTKKELLHVISPTGSLHRYEIAHNDNHHHLVCRSCGAILDIPCAVGNAPCLEPSETHGYQVDEAEVIFWGHCPDCQEQS